MGLDRQWSAHARGNAARLAGIRTFTALGGLAAVAGWLLATYPVVGAVLLDGVALVVAGCVAASRFNVAASVRLWSAGTAAVG